MRHVALGVLALVALVVVACSGDDSGGDGQVVSSDGSAGKSDPAPGARLKDSSGTVVEAPPGSRCWGTSCVDMIGPLTLPRAAKVKAGDQLSVSYDAGAPTTVEYTWMSGPQASAPVQGGYVGWQLQQQEMQQAPSPLRAPATPGDYLLIAFARWEGKGDISYAWYLRVE